MPLSADATLSADPADGDSWMVSLSATAWGSPWVRPTGLIDLMQFSSWEVGVVLTVPRGTPRAEAEERLSFDAWPIQVSHRPSMWEPVIYPGEHHITAQHMNMHMRGHEHALRGHEHEHEHEHIMSMSMNMSTSMNMMIPSSR